MLNGGTTQLDTTPGDVFQIRGYFAAIGFIEAARELVASAPDPYMGRISAMILLLDDWQAGIKLQLTLSILTSILFQLRVTMLSWKGCAMPFA